MKTVIINADGTKFRKLFAKGQPEKGKILAPALITLGIGAVLWYFLLPAINLKSAGFWLFVLFLLLVYLFVKSLWNAAKHIEFTIRRWLICFMVILLAFFVAAAEGSRLFQAKRYSRILTVTEDTVDLIPSVSGSSSIALMDTSSAERLGDRRIGSLSEVVSQFNVGEYMQINWKDAPYKIAPLEYDGFFKWMGNHSNGIPGYVIVDPVDMSAEYEPLQEGMHYVSSAYFHEDLYRHIRFAYPGLLFSNVHFEIDEEGKPQYVASIYDHSIGLFGGTTVTGALIIDPVTGAIEKYNTGEIPVWVDVVFEGDLICTQYNDYAQLRHGFWNSVFSQTDCRQVTSMETEDEDGDSHSYPDYGYIAKDGDVWIYTGVTSLNGDSSNIGFILANERTSETRFITCAGADEFSGMKSAEGEVQEKGYIASFPSLINVEGTPTYIMVLKDDNGLVKMYAAVNVEQYNLVATAATQAECIDKYRTLLHIETGTDADTSAYETKTITIKKIQTIDIDGNTWVYIADENNTIYKALFTDVIDLILHEAGDTLTIRTDGTYFLLQ